MQLFNASNQLVGTFTSIQATPTGLLGPALIVAFLLVSILWVLAYRFVPPPITATMIGDVIAGRHERPPGRRDRLADVGHPLVRADAVVEQRLRHAENQLSVAGRS